MKNWLLGTSEYNEHLWARFPLSYWAWWCLGWAIIITGWACLFYGGHLAMQGEGAPALTLMGVGIILTFLGHTVGGRGTVLWDRQGGH